MPKVIPEHLRISPQPFRQWCAWRLDRAGWMRPNSEPDEGAVVDLAVSLNVSERKLHRWRNEFVWLDRLEVEDALRHAGWELWDVWPDIEDLPLPGIGGNEPGHGSRLSDEVVFQLHELHQKGATIRELARRIWRVAPYSCIESAEHGIRRGFRRLGLEFVALPAGRFGRCKATKTWWPNKGAPCSKFPLPDSDYCMQHDPRRRDEIMEQTARALEARYGVPRQEVAA